MLQPPERRATTPSVIAGLRGEPRACTADPIAPGGSDASLITPPPPDARADRLAAVLARAIGARTARRVLARAQIEFVADRKNPGAKTRRSATSMSDAELRDVVDHPGDPYSAIEVRSAEGELDKRALQASAKPVQTGGGPSEDDLREAQRTLRPVVAPFSVDGVTLVNTLNNGPLDRYDDALSQLKRRKSEVFATFQRARAERAYSALKPEAVDRVRADVFNAFAKAIARATDIRNRKGHPAETTWSEATRATMVKRQPVPFEGQTFVSPYETPTSESTAGLNAPGIQALKTAFGFTDEELHHVVNAIFDGYAKDPTPARRVAWFALLDDMASRWTHLKQEAAEAWVRKYLLPTTDKPYTSLKGAFAELWEVRRVIAEGELAQGTKLRLGSDKVRPVAPGMKTTSPITQDVDLSFHGTSRRHYHEVKADPAALVEKIAEDKPRDTKVKQPSAGPAPPELVATPDQVLSYASARDYHQAKASPRYPTGKEIALTYVTPSTEEWLRIFTTKAGRRLIDHRYELRLKDVHLDTAGLERVQAEVDADTHTVADKDAWAKLNSGVAGPYHDPAKYLAKIK